MSSCSSVSNGVAAFFLLLSAFLYTPFPLLGKLLASQEPVLSSSIQVFGHDRWSVLIIHHRAMYLSQPLLTLGIFAASAASLFASQDIVALHPQQPDVVASGSEQITEGFLKWSNVNFSPTDRLSGMGVSPSADPDSDGLPNLLEYALGSDPNYPTVEESIYLTREDGFWTFSFSTPISRPDVTYEFESSSDLVTWRPVNVTQAIITGDTSTQFWIARIVAHDSEPIFIRVKVTLRPS